uniref:Plastid light harvesting protein n=2 Tax=Pinguiococcus pyrenoidosus TaxID=172671 RepID=A0A7R9U0X8_9STRA|mmetsp:Transcript_1/g.5  ORF Transcript_1/g.5 Transcript_1/m.5 type:complete len:214 (+) Transcript_1:130-771(+)
MFRAFSLLALVASAAAFAPRASPRTSLKLNADLSSIPGSSSPFPGFDPLGLSTDLDDMTLKKYQEAELKHGRIAMLAALGILVQESFHPLFGGAISGPAIFEFQQVDNVYPLFWVAFGTAVAFVEGTTINQGWESIRETKARGADVAGLKEDYTPGDIGFDPLGLCPKDEAGFAEMRTKELNHCRLAMIGVAGMVAQELVLGPGADHGIFASF